MKVDPNEPAYPVEHIGPNPEIGMPIRLAIAVQILAAAKASRSRDCDPAWESREALLWADALIAEHNRGQA